MIIIIITNYSNQTVLYRQPHNYTTITTTHHQLQDWYTYLTNSPCFDHPPAPPRHSILLLITITANAQLFHFDHPTWTPSFSLCATKTTVHRSLLSTIPHPPRITLWTRKLLFLCSAVLADNNFTTTVTCHRPPLFALALSRQQRRRPATRVHRWLLDRGFYQQWSSSGDTTTTTTTFSALNCH